MAYDPFRHHRRSIRLGGYDYRGTGVYFVTLCTWNRECIFGDVVDGVLQLNEIGHIVCDEWRRTADLRTSVAIDEYTVMPNHLHGVLAINRPEGMPHDRRGDLRSPNQSTNGGGRPRFAPTDRARGPVAGSLGAIVTGFKSATTRRINAMRGTPGSPVWQRNYYERIVRNDTELGRTRIYIRQNPLCWYDDPEYPTR